VEWSLQGNSQDDQVFLLYGRVPRIAVRLNLVFADGETSNVGLTKGFFIFEIPADHLERARRPARFIAYAADGEEAANTQLPGEALSVVLG
jgi:hypothetical protein